MLLLRFQPRCVVKEPLNYRLLLVCCSHGADQPGKGSISAFPLAGKSFAGKQMNPEQMKGNILELKGRELGGVCNQVRTRNADIKEQQ